MFRLQIDIAAVLHRIDIIIIIIIIITRMGCNELIGSKCTNYREKTDGSPDLLHALANDGVAVPTLVRSAL